MILNITDLAGNVRPARVIAADRVAWEAHARKAGYPMTPRVTHAGTDAQDVDVSSFPIDTWHTYLAWSADTRGAAKRPSFGDWLADVDSVAEDKGEPEPDPTRPDHGPD